MHDQGLLRLFLAWQAAHRHFAIQNEAADDEEAKLPESKGKPQKSKKSGRLQKAKAISAALEAADEQQEPADPEVSLHLKKDQRKEKPATELAPPSEPDAESDEEPESESESEEDSDAEAKQRWARLRGLAGPETSSEEDEASGSDTDAEVPDEDLDEEVMLQACMLRTCVLLPYPTDREWILYTLSVLWAVLLFQQLQECASCRLAKRPSLSLGADILLSPFRAV